jgi:hypothetical protein
MVTPTLDAIAWAAACLEGRAAAGARSGSVRAPRWGGGSDAEATARALAVTASALDDALRVAAALVPDGWPFTLDAE